MPKLKAKYKLNELEKAWKEFEPITVHKTGLSKLLRACGDFDLKVLTTQKEAKKWADLFNETTGKLNEVRKLDAIKKDKDILTFLDRAGEALSSGPDTKELWQIAAGNREYDATTGSWEHSASIKKQTGRG